MTLAPRAIAITTLALVLVNCSKGKTPDTSTAAATGVAGSLNVLGAYDLNTVAQIQFETSATNSFRPAPGPNDVTSKVLILVVNGPAVTNAGIFIKNANGAQCTGSVAAFNSSNLFAALAAGVIGPNSNSAVTPDSGYDRLSIFFKDGTSVVIPFDDMGAPVNAKVILESAQAPLENLLDSLYASGNCQPN